MTVLSLADNLRDHPRYFSLSILIKRNAHALLTKRPLKISIEITNVRPQIWPKNRENERVKREIPRHFREFAA